MIYSNGNWINSAISGFFGALDGRYSTNAHNHDGMYAPVGASYLKGETYPAASLYTKAQLYTKTEIDAMIGGGGGGGGGTVTTATNVGSGTGIFKDVSGSAIRLRSLISSNNSIDFNIVGDTVDLTFTGTRLQSLGSQDVLTGRASHGSGIVSYTSRQGNTGQPSGETYGSGIVWGTGTSGSVELWGGWASGNWGRLWVRGLRDTTDNWSAWYEVYTSRSDIPWSNLSGVPTAATRWPTWAEVNSQSSDQLDYNKVKADHFLTTKGNSTGNFSTSGNIESGRGSGGVALTINDGKGNANVTWNHAFGSPEQDGNAARIEVNTDSTSGAMFSFELGSGVTKDVDVNLNQVMYLSESEFKYKAYKVWHAGNHGSGSGLDADTLDGYHASSFTLKPNDHTNNNSEYHVVWENRRGVLYTSGAHFTYNPALRRLWTAGSVETNELVANATLTVNSNQTNAITINKPNGNEYSGLSFKTANKTTWLLHTGNDGAENLNLQYRDPATGDYVGTAITFYNASGKVRVTEGLQVGNELITDPGSVTHLGGPIITSSAAQLQVNGFSRMGDIFMHADNTEGIGQYQIHVTGNMVRFDEKLVGNGYVKIGCSDASWGRIQTDRPSFYMNKALYNGNGFYVHGTRSKLTSDRVEVGANNNNYTRLEQDGNIIHRQTGWANNSSETAIFRRNYTANTGDYIQIHATGNGTVNGAMVVGRNVFAVGMSNYDSPNGSQAEPLNNANWMSVTASNVRFNGNTAFRTYDNWLRINDQGEFGSGVYFGSSTVRVDGTFQHGNGGENVLITASESRFSNIVKLDEVRSRSGNSICIGAGELGNYLQDESNSRYGTSNEYIHIGGENGVMAWSSPNNMDASNGGANAASTMHSVKLLDDSGKTSLKMLDINSDGDESNLNLIGGNGRYARAYYRTSDHKFGFYIHSAAGNIATRLSWDGSNDTWLTSGNLELTGYGYAKSHGSGTNYSPIMTHGDFLPDQPPAGLEGAITSPWISAGAVNAKHLQVNGGTKAPNGEKRSFKIAPDDPRPLHFALLNDDLSVKKDIFYLQETGDAFFAGKLSKDTVDINSIQEEARKQINPHYLGTAPGSRQSKSDVTLTSGQGVALPAVSTIDGNVNISFSLRAYEGYMEDSNQNYTAPDWTIELRRNSASGAVLFSKRYKGYAQNWEDNIPVGWDFGWEGSSILNVEEVFKDSAAPATEVYYIRVVRHGGTPTSIKVLDFEAESPSFRTNKLKTSGAMDVFWEKETGYMITTGRHFVNEDQALTITFPYAYDDVHTATISGYANITSSADSHNSYVSDLGTTSIRITNGDEYSNGKVIHWQVTGRRASSI